MSRARSNPAAGATAREKAAALDLLAGLLDRVGATPGAMRELVDMAEKSARVIAAGADEYRASHWGKSGTGGAERLNVVDPRSAEATVVLGELVEVAYETQKGKERAPSIYVHPFEGTRPLLCYVPGMKARGLLIAGGSYRVEHRGIVG